jgi:hypothetical protein
MQAPDRTAGAYSENSESNLRKPSMIPFDAMRVPYTEK